MCVGVCVGGGKGGRAVDAVGRLVPRSLSSRFFVMPSSLVLLFIVFVPHPCPQVASCQGVSSSCTLLHHTPPANTKKPCLSCPSLPVVCSPILPPARVAFDATPLLNPHTYCVQSCVDLSCDFFLPSSLPLLRPSWLLLLLLSLFFVHDDGLSRSTFASSCYCFTSLP